MSYLNAAIEYHRSGLKIIPFWNGEGGKKTFPSGYAVFRTAQSEQDVNRLFARDCDGVALLCTDGIEAVDIDVKHDPKGTITKDLIESLDVFNFEMDGVVQITKSGGRHLIYRCPKPEGNQKLARRRGEKEAMIETRGEGGILFIAPTPGYTIASGSLLGIPTATQEQRDELIRICRHFDESEPERFESRLPEADKKQLAHGSKTPWEAYDEATDILALIEHYGWHRIGKQGDYIRLNRPGAKHRAGVDGSVCTSANYFYPFTSSSEFEPNKGYRPSSVLALLEYGGDFSRTAKELYRQGFGDRLTTQKETEKQEVKNRLPELLQKAELTRFDIRKKIAEPKPLLMFDDRKPIGGRGMIGVFTGHEKSGKSFVASCIASTALCRGESLNFSLDLDGGKMIWFDTEQSAYFYEKTQERIYRLAGIESNPDNYAAYHLRRFAAPERMEIVEHLIYNTPGLSVVVLDGFIDLIGDYNDLPQTQEYVGRLMKWSDEKKVLIMGVLHVNKGDGKIRGHIGSELKNKCDFIIHTVKSENMFTISNPTSRYMAFPDMDFTRDEVGMPVYQRKMPDNYARQGESKPDNYALMNGYRKEPDEQPIPF